MGREVTGVRIEQNKSPYAKVKPKVSADSNQESNTKTPEGNIELKDCEVKQCTSEVPRAENSCDKQEVLAINFDIEKLDIKSPIAEDQKMSSPDKASAVTAAAENLKLNTPQKPTNVRIDKQVWESLRAAETPVSPSLSNPKSPSSSRKSQPTTPFVARRPFADDEDNWSVASSARTTRSRTTVAVAPTFTCNDRLEKRKEYYAKLEEKRKALEAEKKEYEARTKEDEEAAVKQLRKNMMFRANPVPNFYYEKPPPKKELKKIPTTRAVSPKFGRRKSCSDAINSQSEDKTNVRASRRSLGSLRESSSPNSSSLKKDPLVKSRLKQVKESTKNTATKITEKSNPDIAVHS